MVGSLWWGCTLFLFCYIRFQFFRTLLNYCVTLSKFLKLFLNLRFLPLHGNFTKKETCEVESSSSSLSNRIDVNHFARWILEPFSYLLLHMISISPTLVHLLWYFRNVLEAASRLEIFLLKEKTTSRGQL